MASLVKSTYVYTKLRKSFGRQPVFQNVPAHILDSINPSIEDQKNYVLRNPVNREVQAVNSMSSEEVNTPVLETYEQGINHEEGGWPKDVQIFNEEHTLRHRRRVMHDESYWGTILNLAPSMIHYINQNNAIEMYETYYSKFPPQRPKEVYSLRIANIFRDLQKRPVACLKFTNEPNAKLIASYCYKTCMPDPQLNSLNKCSIWDINIQTDPVSIILPEYPCWQLACSPVVPEVVICGLENGTVHVFDIRERNHKAVASSYVHNSHRESVTSLRFVNSRTNTEFFSGSSEGQCLWWDTRNLSEPLDQLPMSIRIPPSQKPDLSNAEGVSYLEYDYGVPTKFLCGTESGLVINVNRMGRTHNDKLISYWDAHTGPVQTIQRSSCTMRMFLTCGDYTVRIWSEEVRTAPIMVFKPYKNLVCDACWAPLRYSSFMSICEGGYYYFWDLLRKHHEPAITLKVSENPLTQMTPDKTGSVVAIGDCTGSIHLLQLSDNMTAPDSYDKALMQQIYERETRREHLLDNRQKELRLRARNEEEQLSESVTYTMDEEDELETVTEEYFKIVNEELKAMDMLTEQHVE